MPLMPRSVYITDTVKFEYYDDDWPGVPQVGPRRIAGSKRVARYEQSHASSGRLMQSITAHPDLSTRSFEELRAECYAQLAAAVQGNIPTTPGTVIPPLFDAYHDKTDDILPNEITMAD